MGELRDYLYQRLEAHSYHNLSQTSEIILKWISPNTHSQRPYDGMRIVKEWRTYHGEQAPEEPEHEQDTP